MEDRDETGLEPWIDAPDIRHKDAATLSGQPGVDQQISEVIANVEAIVYFVGPTDSGPYQGKVEAEQVRKVLIQRQAQNKPIWFVPVLLSDGSEADLPEWARCYTIVNRDRMLRSSPLIWAHIKQRLRTEPEPMTLVEERTALPNGRDQVETIINALKRPPKLTLFIGPYAFAKEGNETIGPAAMTSHLLALINMNVQHLQPMIPWPSESGEWATLAVGKDKVEKVWTRYLAGLGRHPPDLANSIGYLANRWVSRFGNRSENEKDWHGLLLLTTRVDLALESALSKIHNVSFTRILPTLERAPTSERRRLIQHWHPDPNWDPDPDPGAISPRVDNADTNPPLANLSIDQAERVILVKSA